MIISIILFILGLLIGHLFTKEHYKLLDKENDFLKKECECFTKNIKSYT